MTGEEPQASVLLSALAGAWRCEAVRVHTMPAGGLAVPQGDAQGLRLYWTDGALSRITWNTSGASRELLVPAASLVLLPRGLAHQLSPQSGMAWALAADRSVAMTLLIAESKPSEKDMLCRVLVHLIVRGG